VHHRIYYGKGGKREGLSGKEEVKVKGGGQTTSSLKDRRSLSNKQKEVQKKRVSVGKKQRLTIPEKPPSSKASAGVASWRKNGKKDQHNSKAKGGSRVNE